MSTRTIEGNFDYQVKKILLSTFEGEEISNLDNVDNFVEEVYKNKNLMQELGKKLIDSISDFSGDEIFEEVIDKLGNNFKAS
ncbi:hypothetical protein FC831_15265 [Clostridium botulinum]|nr:hypothetical protein [Clostridium botulinum]